MTDVNHDPGPRTTQSASSTAATVSGQTGGASAPVVRPPRDRPPRRPPPGRARLALPEGCAGSRTSASISRGTAAMGSTRPWAPRSRATQSRPSTVSWVSHKAAMRRFPSECPRGRPGPEKRCCSTSLQVRPQASSRQSAASAIRRSPGGRMPNSSRSRPLDPPSSATVTTAVSRRVTCRRRLQRGRQPVSPAQGDDSGPDGPTAARPAGGRPPLRSLAT